MADLTVGALTLNILGQVQGRQKGTTTTLTAGISAVDVTIPVQTDARIIQGQTIGVGLEKMEVTAYNSTTGAATVVRGTDGTTPAIATSGDIVYVAWRWFPSDVQNEIEKEIRSWDYELFRVQNVDIATIDSTRTYSLAVTDFRYMLLLEYEDLTTPLELGVGAATVRQNSTGLVLRFNCAPYTSRLTMMYAGSFDLTGFADTETWANIGVPDGYHDIIQYGVNARLLAMREPSRSSTGTQPDPVKAETIRILDTARQAQFLRQMADVRIEQEIGRLRQDWPVRF